MKRSGILPIAHTRICRYRWRSWWKADKHGDGLNSLEDLVWEDQICANMGWLWCCKCGLLVIEREARGMVKICAAERVGFRAQIGIGRTEEQISDHKVTDTLASHAILRYVT